MKAREAEELIAKALTNVANGAELGRFIGDSEILGYRRSQAIYARKLKQNEIIEANHSLSLFRRLLLAISFPIRVMNRILRS